MNLTVLKHSQSRFHCSKGRAVSFISRLFFSIASIFLFAFFTELKAQTATIAVSDNDVCLNGTSPVITFTGNGGTPEYTFTYTINGVGATTTAVSAGDVINLPVPTGTAGTFVYDLVSVQDNNGTEHLLPLVFQLLR